MAGYHDLSCPVPGAPCNKGWLRRPWHGIGVLAELCEQSRISNRHEWLILVSNFVVEP